MVSELNAKNIILYQAGLDHFKKELKNKIAYAYDTYCYSKLDPLFITLKEMDKKTFNKVNKNLIGVCDNRAIADFPKTMNYLVQNIDLAKTYLEEYNQYKIFIKNFAALWVERKQTEANECYLECRLRIIAKLKQSYRKSYEERGFTDEQFLLELLGSLPKHLDEEMRASCAELRIKLMNDLNGRDFKSRKDRRLVNQRRMVGHIKPINNM